MSLRAWDAPAPSERCCGRWWWHDGGRWVCGACEPPPPGDRAPRCYGGAVLAEFYASVAGLASKEVEPAGANARGPNVLLGANATEAGCQLVITLPPG